MRALVIGLGISGRAAGELLGAQGHDVVGFDERADAGSGWTGGEIRTGGWEPALLDGVDLVVPSPGIPETGPILRDVIASGLPVWSELELGYRALRDVPVGAVTGTNGKTTVTEMATSMLRESGIEALAVGNIGAPISTAPAAAAYVVEASSFQLRFVDAFRASAAAVVSFAPDHLDWHPDVAAYGAAKARIFENMGSDDPVVYDADDAGAAGLVSGAWTRLIGVSGTVRVGASGRDGEDLVLAGARIPIEALPSADRTLLVDLAVAAEVAAALGASQDAIAAAALSYRQGRHRREIVAEAGGVTFIDDSKATNPHAALAAIGAYPSVVLIAGGRAKGLDVTPLAVAERVRGLVAIGESAAKLLEARPDAVVAGSMAEAVTEAIALSRPGDVVLLAPGCASFDMFDSYGHRGDVFAAAVREAVAS
jgi:UDP-N-acetylmuramoylalanine--D-glutamate ligase